VILEGDTVRVIGFQDDSLVALLEREPSTTPHASIHGAYHNDWLVLTGTPEQLRTFVARAYRDPAMLSDTAIFVRTSRTVASDLQGR
jgi:hypothetical protein